jgi:hypothetical protein
MPPQEESARVQSSQRAKAWCRICFALGLLLINYPILQIFNQSMSLGGVPLMVVYLMGIWLVGIVVLFILSRFLLKSADKG